jgi:hypothetical protein
MALAPRPVQASRVMSLLARRPISLAALATLATFAFAAHADPAPAVGVAIACPPKLAAYTDSSTQFSVRFAEAALSGATFDAAARSLQCTYGPQGTSDLVSIEQTVSGTGCEVKMRNKVVCGAAPPVSLPTEILPVKSPAQPGWSVLYGTLSLANVELKPQAAARRSRPRRTRRGRTPARRRCCRRATPTAR